MELGFYDGRRMRLWTCPSAMPAPDGKPVYLAYGPAGQCLPSNLAWVSVTPPGTRAVIALRPGPCGHPKFLQADTTPN